MLPLPALGIGGALALLAGFLGGWTVRDWKADSDALEVAQQAWKDLRHAEDRGDAAAARYEQLVTGQQAASIETRNTIREIYRETKVPADCALPDAAVGVLHDILQRANAAAAGEPARAVPAAAGPADAGD